MAQVQQIRTGTAYVEAALGRYYGGGKAKILWVCNRSDLPSGDGTSPDYPCATLGGATGAIAKLQGTAGYGHVIFVMPGHAESVSAADYFSDTGTASAFAIVGLGTGTMRPSLTWTVTGSTWLMDTANVQVDNMRLFLAGAHAAGSALTVAAPITVSAAGCAIRNCDIRFGFDSDQIVTVGITLGTSADDFVFENNFARGEVAAEVTATGTFIRLNGADRCIIRNNYITGALATDTDGLIETLTTLSADVQILDNFISAIGSGNTCAVDFGADLVCTGRLQRNLLVVNADGTAETVVFTKHANNNMALLDNFMVTDNNERGLVIGTATA